MRPSLLLAVLLTLLLGCPTGGGRDDDDAGDDDDATGDDDDATGDDDDATVDPCPSPVSLCSGDCLLNVDVDPVRLTGLLTWDGAAIPQHGQNEWNIVFVDPATGDELSVPRSGNQGSPGTYDIPALPGTWDVYFEWTNTADDTNASWPDPVQGRWLAQANFTVPTGGGSLNITPDPVRVTGLLQWDGAAIGAHGGNDWEFVFVDTTTGLEYSVDRDASGGSPISTYDIPMYPGTYDVYFAWTTTVQDNSTQWPDPVLGRRLIQANFNVPSGGGSLNVEPDPVRVTGLLSWDGAAIGWASSNLWQFMFEDTTSDAVYTVQRDAGLGATNTFDIPMYPGTYDVSFAWVNTPPTNNSAWPDPVWGNKLIQASFTVPTGGGSINVEPDPERVSGLLSWDGAAIPDHNENMVQLVFDDVASDAEYTVRIEAGGASTYDVPMYPGTYDVYFDWWTVPYSTASNWPDPVHGRRLIQSSVTVASGGTALNVMPDPVRMSGLLSWDGAAIPQDTFNSIVLTFEDQTSDAVYSVIRTEPGATYDIPMYPGTYAVSFDWLTAAPSGNADWPDHIVGPRELFATLTVPASGGTANLEPDPLRMTGLLQWDGGDLAEHSQNEWQLLFVDPYDAESWWSPRDASDFPLNTYDVPVYTDVVHVYFQWTNNPVYTHSDWMDPMYGPILIQSCALIQ